MSTTPAFAQLKALESGLQRERERVDSCKGLGVPVDDSINTVADALAAQIELVKPAAVGGERQHIGVLLTEHQRDYAAAVKAGHHAAAEQVSKYIAELEDRRDALSLIDTDAQGSN